MAQTTGSRISTGQWLRQHGGLSTRKNRHIPRLKEPPLTTRASGRLAGKNILITGASRGIGRAIALACAREGANLCLTATNAETLGEVANEARHAGVETTTLAADVSDEQQVRVLFESAITWRGHIDVLVNNAGIYIGRPFTQYTLAEFDRLMKVNVYAVFQLMQLALAHMSPSGGKIVNIASTAGKWESPNQAAYNTSKHAVVGMTRCAALEYAALGVNVNAICPGLVDTDMLGNFEPRPDAGIVSAEDVRAAALGRIPMGRFLQPEEIAAIAVYLASAESDGMTGQTITISGGMRMG